MSSTTVAKTLDVLREWFATHGIPMLLLVSLPANYFCNVISEQGSLYHSPTLRKLYGISKPRRSLHMTAVLELVSGLEENEFWFHPDPDWIPGIIAEVLGPVTYVIETDEGQRWKRHADQIKSCSSG